ncbi:class IV adenylate cyclase [Actinophytocola sediminis]
MRYVEIERKFVLSDPVPLKARLRALGARPESPVRQTDAYYNAPHRDFLGSAVISEWLRIRVEDGGGSVNFKRFHPVGAVAPTHADEFETAVDDVTAVRKLLEALDFRPLVTVEKTREAYRLADVEVAFDQVVGAGDFVEFEYTGDADGVEDAVGRLDRRIASFGVELGAPVDRGYPHMLLGRKH